MRFISRLSGVAAALFLAGGALAIAQQAQPPQTPPGQPVYRARTRLTVETVSVKDKDGNPVEGLTAKDFIVTENGEPQTISFVEYQKLDTRVISTMSAADVASILPVNPAPQERPPRAPSTFGQQQIATSAPARSAIRASGCWCSTRPDVAAAGGSDAHLHRGAQKYVDSMMTASDLMASCTTTARRCACRRIHQRSRTAADRHPERRLWRRSER
jgi:hypothetical protein